MKLLRLLQNYPPPDDPGVRGRLNECLETILNKAQEPPKSKKVQHSNAKNSVLFEAISLIIHNDRYLYVHDILLILYFFENMTGLIQESYFFFDTFWHKEQVKK